MTISFQCPGCKKGFTVKDELAEKRGKCPTCGQLIVVPSAHTASRPKTADPSLEKPPASSKGEPIVADSPASLGKRVRWPWYAAGVATTLGLVATVVFIFAMPGKGRAPAKTELPASPLPTAERIEDARLEPNLEEKPDANYQEHDTTKTQTTPSGAPIGEDFEISLGQWTGPNHIREYFTMEINNQPTTFVILFTVYETTALINYTGTKPITVSLGFDPETERSVRSFEQSVMKISPSEVPLSPGSIQEVLVRTGMHNTWYNKLTDIQRQRFEETCKSARVIVLPPARRPDAGEGQIEYPAKDVDAFLMELQGRGILSVSAVRRDEVIAVFTEYVESRPVRRFEEPRKPERGAFLIVEVKYKWTIEEPSEGTFWIGEDYSSVIDSDGNRFPAKGVLDWHDGRFLRIGGAMGSTVRPCVEDPDGLRRALVYFDVPAASQRFELLLSKDGPAINVKEVNDFEDQKRSSDAVDARRHQEETARRLGIPVEKTIDLGEGVTLEMLLIPAGEFMMGGDQSAEEVVHLGGGNLAWYQREHLQRRVRITQPFYMGKYEVTQAQYERVMGNNPSGFEGANNPVERVSWNDAQEFIRRAGNNLRLPTEAEWEYACRAGTSTPFHFGSTISTDQANYDGNYVYGAGQRGTYRGRTTEVGSFPSNAWALHDMHGNVWEWVSDRFQDSYRGLETTDPTGPRTGEYRVFRGGSWDLNPRNCRSAVRVRDTPDVRSYSYGFRVLSPVR